MRPISERGKYTLKMDSAMDMKRQTTTEQNIDISTINNINLPIYESFNQFIMNVLFSF